MRGHMQATPSHARHSEHATQTSCSVTSPSCMPGLPRESLSELSKVTADSPARHPALVPLPGPSSGGRPSLLGAVALVAWVAEVAAAPACRAPSPASALPAPRSYRA